MLGTANGIFQAGIQQPPKAKYGPLILPALTLSCLMETGTLARKRWDIHIHWKKQLQKAEI